MLRRMQTSYFRSFALGALALAATSSGCAYGEIRQVVRAQFASELNCPDARAEERKRYDEGFKDGQLKVEGCGVIRIYTCPADAGLVSYDEKLCTFEDVKQVENKAPAAGPSPDEALPMDDMADEPAAAEPAAAPEKPKAKSGKSGPKPSGKFKASLSTESSVEAGDQ